MEFRKYEYVIAVARCKSMTKAANELFISQPSLSAFIAKIESELGTLLFDRTKNPIRTTLAGEIYVETGKKIIELHNNMRAQIMDINSNNKGRLKVGIPGSRGSYMLPIIYPLFKEKFPNIDIEIIENKSRILMDYIGEKTIDIGIMPKLYDNKDLVFKKMYDEELFLISGDGFIKKEDLISDNIINLQSLQKYKFVMLKKGHGIRTAIDKFFAKNSISPKILFETSNNSTAFRLACKNQSLAIVPKMTIDICSDVKDAEVYRLTKEGLMWEICAIINRERQDDYLLNEFISLATEMFS